MENSKRKQIENFGVNRMGRNIRKTHLNHQNYGSSSSQQPESEVIHIINKEDFKSFVQRMTGSPDHPPNKPLNNPLPNNTRLQNLRPPSLSRVWPAFPIPTPVPISFAAPTSDSISAAPTAPPPGIIDFPKIPDGFTEPSATSTPLHPNTTAPDTITVAPSTIALQPISVEPNTISAQPSTDEFPWHLSNDNMVESPISAYVRQLLENPDSNVDEFQLLFC